MLVRRNTTTPILYYNYSHSQTSLHTHAKNSHSMGKTIHYWGLKYMSGPQVSGGLLDFGSTANVCKCMYEIKVHCHTHTRFFLGRLHEHIWGHRWLAQNGFQNTRRILSAENQTHTHGCILTFAVTPLPVQQGTGEGTRPHSCTCCRRPDCLLVLLREPTF